VTTQQITLSAPVPAGGTIIVPKALADGDVLTATVHVPASPAPPHLLFGLGSEADSASTSPLAGTAPLGMLSSWFNGTGDLTWMKGWAANLIPNQYALGRALHLIVYARAAAITATPTKYGPAVGRAYPLSAQFQTDMIALSKVWAGPVSGPPLYVTLMDEFQTYSATRTWAGDQPYWSALKDAYRMALATFHANAPNARVSIGWGGWESRSATPMFGDFADIMAASDFQSFQAMQDDTNVADFTGMTAALGKYGPVLCSHYKPNAGSQVVFDADTTALLTDASLVQLNGLGLFGFSFMDQVNLAPAATFARIAAAMTRYGKLGAPTVVPPPIVPPPVVVPPPPKPLPNPSDLQADINAMGAGGVLDITGYTFTGSYTIPRTITLKGGTIISPSAQTALAATNVAGIVIDGTIFSGKGNAGAYASAIWMYNCAGLIARNFDITDFVYAAVMQLNCLGSLIENFHIARIGMGRPNGTNAYGLSFTEDADAKYSSGTVQDGLVEDIPTWQGIASHNSKDLIVQRCIVRRTRRAFFFDPNGAFRLTGLQVRNNRAESPLPVTYDPTGYFVGNSDGAIFDSNFLSKDYPHPADGGEWMAGIRDYGAASTKLVRTNTTVG
jgi:Right handed beta helix region